MDPCGRSGVHRDIGVIVSEATPQYWLECVEEVYAGMKESDLDTLLGNADGYRAAFWVERLKSGKEKVLGAGAIASYVVENDGNCVIKSIIFPGSTPLRGRWDEAFIDLMSNFASDVLSGDVDCLEILMTESQSDIVESLFDIGFDVELIRCAEYLDSDDSWSFHNYRCLFDRPECVA